MFLTYVNLDFAIGSSYLYWYFFMFGGCKFLRGVCWDAVETIRYVVCDVYVGCGGCCVVGDPFTC